MQTYLLKLQYSLNKRKETRQAEQVVSSRAREILTTNEETTKLIPRARAPSTKRAGR